MSSLGGGCERLDPTPDMAPPRAQIAKAEHDLSQLGASNNGIANANPHDMVWLAMAKNTTVDAPTLIRVAHQPLGSRINGRLKACAKSNMQIKTIYCMHT